MAYNFGSWNFVDGNKELNCPKRMFGVKSGILLTAKAALLGMLLLPLTLYAQDRKDEGEGVIQVEIRQVERERDASVANGSIPDSLDGKYFIHDNGKVYKHFGLYEAAVAHFRKESYHPRNEVETEEDVIYISDFSKDVIEKLPELIRVEVRQEALNAVEKVR